jgi:hypothetical protein
MAWHLRDHYYIHSSLSLISILRQRNPVCTLPSCFFQMFQYYAPICAKTFQADSCLQVSYQNPVKKSILFHAWQMLNPSIPQWTDHHDIWHRVHTNLSHTAEVNILHRSFSVKTEELPKYLDGYILERIMKKIYKRHGHTKTWGWELNWAGSVRILWQVFGLVLM